ncbi:MAG: aminotransferase class I/II-fold pyridoxal phosphate-dependent enzyme [Hyphomicrobiaceae bacterium]|nr:aminotransferase class I/II-fold pyridoxal phosphate-dependent enzyme [Hyphomicrobiaceae bacterium]
MAQALLRDPARRSNIDSFIVMDVMRMAAADEAAGRSIIHMEVGQPATPAPLAAREAAKRAIDSNNLGYTLALGMTPLRERITQHYSESYGVSVDPGRVVVTTGSSAAFVLAFLALFDAGARVALPSPGYPCYRHILTALGVDPVIVTTGPATRWMPDPEDIARLHALAGLDGLLVASPANPTGTMLTPDHLAALTKVCRDNGIWFISDEIYHGLTYTQPAATALQSSDDAIVINSFSKYFSMTGWRVGWLIVPDALVRVVERLAQNLYIAPPAIAQVAALGAFDAREELEANRRVYAANRELLLQELPKAGFTDIVPADGAFYLYANVSALTGDALEFCGRMLREAGVATTPGVDFDAARGNQYVRFSYAGSTPDMQEAARRLHAWPLLKR